MSRISEFLSVINRSNGLSSPNRVRTTITGPSLLGISRDLAAFCPISALPGVQIENELIRHAGIGKTEQRPTDINFNSIGLQFFCDNNGDVLKYFHDWMDLIVSTKESVSNTSLFSFPDDYVGTVEIEARTADNSIMKKYSLRRAFPVSIEDVSTGWDMTDSLILLPVTFTYFNWETSNRRGQSVGPTTFTG